MTRQDRDNLESALIIALGEMQPQTPVKTIDRFLRKCTDEEIQALVNSEKLRPALENAVKVIKGMVTLQ